MFLFELVLKNIKPMKMPYGILLTSKALVFRRSFKTTLFLYLGSIANIDQH